MLTVKYLIIDASLTIFVYHINLRNNISNINCIDYKFISYMNHHI